MPAYRNSCWDRVRKSKAALVLCSGGALTGIALIACVVVVFLLTYVGVTQYERQYDHHVMVLNHQLMVRKSCMGCQLVRESTWMCDDCGSSETFTGMERSLKDMTEQETRVAIHEAVGFLWKWMNGIVWPTMALSAWVFMLQNVSVHWALISMAWWCMTAVFFVIKWFLWAPAAQFKSALADANSTPPVSFKTPSVRDMMMGNGEPVIDISGDNTTLGGIRQRQGWQI